MNLTYSSFIPFSGVKNTSFFNETYFVLDYTDADAQLSLYLVEVVTDVTTPHSERLPGSSPDSVGTSPLGNLSSCRKSHTQDVKA